MRPLLLTLLLLASLPTFPQTADSSQPEGTINGSVLDEHGQRFKGVTVCTYMIGAPSGSKEARGDCPVTTDEAGQFRIDHMAMGTFGVEAIKPEDGYIAFAGTSVKKMVTLTPSQSAATVTLKLGPKPGVLLPTAKDKFTGKLVTDFEVGWGFLYPDQPNSSSSLGQTISSGQTISKGGTRAIVPPEKYLVLTIFARGYKKWFYHDPSNPSLPAFIRFQPGEEKELLVELEPQAKDQTDLGAKPGVLLPSVKDKFTGKPVTDFEVRWMFLDPDQPNSSASGEQGGTRAIVPPEKYLVLTIFARGYKKWFYHDPSNPSLPAFIRFQPGEEKELLVELEPQASAAR
jgi:hypothetical protein